MKNKFQSIIKISIFIIVCGIILTGIYLFRSGNSLGSDYLKVSKFNPNETLNDSNRQATKQEPVDKVTETDIVLEKENEKVEYELEQGGWIPNWAQSSGMESYSNNPERFNSISPVWYVLNANQKLEAKSGAKDSTVLSKLKSNGTKVIPTISSFDSDILSKLINNPDLVNGFTDEVLSEVKIYSYDGIDIDFESIKSNDKGKFTEFIKVLSEKLHKENKLLTIAVLSKDSDLYDSVNLTGVGGFESRSAQDWKEIGKYTDQFRIMGYDYTHSYDSAGPIAPLNWLEDILTYATQNVDPDKIYLGLPLYAYLWKVDKQGADALTNSQVQSKIASADKVIQNELITDKGENYLHYSKNGEQYEIWYQSKEANDMRIALAKKYKIKGIYYWRLGNDGL